MPTREQSEPPPEQEEDDCQHHAPLTQDDGRTFCADCGEELP